MAVLLTTLETEMSTAAVDQDLAEQTVDQDLAEQTVDQDLAEKIENIISKVHRILNVPEKTDEIDGEVAYQFIRQLENNKMFRNKLRASDRCKWADFLVMLPYSERRPEYCKKILLTSMRCSPNLSWKYWKYAPPKVALFLQKRKSQK